MLNRKKRYGGDNITRMFLSSSIAMIITQMAGVVANLIDGVITSMYLGAEAYSAMSLLGPFTGVIGMLAGFFATGSQVVCSQMIGNGKKKEANQVESAW